MPATPVPATGKSAMAKRIVVLGSTGFHGRAIADALRLHDDIELRTHGRRAAANASPLRFVGDITDPGFLRDAVDGADVVIHAVSYVGNDPELARRTNAEGTADIVAAVAGRSRILYLSTTSVSGQGPHRGSPERPARPRLLSPVSSSRLAAERLVLHAGGAVIRPNLVYGTGDRWFIPGLVRLTRGIGGQVNSGRALISVIDVESLGRIVARLAMLPANHGHGRVFHAVNPTPVTVRSVLEECSRAIPLALPERAIPYLQALDAAASLGITAHQLSLAAEDNWFDGAEGWGATAAGAADEFRLSAPATAWYRDALGIGTALSRRETP